MSLTSRIIRPIILYSFFPSQGQGTLFVEMNSQLDEPLDFLIVPVGGMKGEEMRKGVVVMLVGYLFMLSCVLCVGGGMLSGVSVACKGLSPHTVVIGAEVNILFQDEFSSLPHMSFQNLLLR